jgi:hypothetical protein
MKRTLLLTATIRPPENAHKLARSDPKLRRADYVAAFRGVLESAGGAFDEVAFAENSGADLGEFREIAGARRGLPAARVLGYDANDFPPEWGRAYGEFRLLDLAFADLAPADDDELWKVTGRVRVTNLAQIAEAAPRPFDLYCDCRRLPRIPGLYAGKRWMDMRLFAVSGAFYRRELLGLHPRLRHELTGTPEPWFFERVLAWRARYRVRPRMNRQPLLEGFAGYDNKDLGSPRQRALAGLRTLTRRAAPFLWI